MIVGVSGGRTYDRWQVIHPVLTKFHVRYGITGIIQGEAKGADFCAKTWAYNNRVPLIGPEGTSDVGFKADWDRWGRSAGYRRNEEMARADPDLFLIFQGGVGTKQMCEIAAIKYGIPTLVIPDLEWARAQDPDEEILVFGNAEGEAPKKDPWWACKPKASQRWPVIDHEAVAKRQAEIAASKDRYIDEALF